MTATEIVCGALGIAMIIVGCIGLALRGWYLSKSGKLLTTRPLDDPVIKSALLVAVLGVLLSLISSISLLIGNMGA